jgi:trypsin
LALWGTVACGPSAAAEDAVLDLPAPVPGYPEHTSSLRLSIDRTQTKQCHATLVAPQWAITAAHCFSGVSPEGRGRLREFDRGFATGDVQFHPLAHESGATRLDGVWQNDEFSAAHDLALIPLEPVERATARALWSTAPGCDALDLRELPAHRGRLTGDGRAETVSAVVLGAREASSLLGPGQHGALLAVLGTGALPGDSGGGVAVRASDLARAAECLLDDPSAPDVLIGVLQDANPYDPRAPLGVTPLYLPEHATWIAETLRDWTPAPSTGEPPVLDEPCLDPYGCD